VRETLRSEVVAFLQSNGAATRTEIALGVGARRADVDVLLVSGGFSRVDAPEGRSTRGKFWNLSEAVPARRGGKSCAERMLDVLRDGKWHSRTEIFVAAGGFFLTNNAASELRTKHGVNIEFGYGKGQVPQYRLAQPAAMRAPAAASISGAVGSSTSPHPISPGRRRALSRTVRTAA
jgi:hypothetical protein